MDNKLNSIKTLYSFDDLLILPNASIIEPNEAEISSIFTKNIVLKKPFVSSPMDTVTEHRMAIALAKNGCIGVIHRNMSIEKEVDEVKKVKSIDGEEESTIDNNGKLRVAAAIGPFDIERAKKLNSVKVDAIVIDCAHGHNLNVIKSIEKIKKEISSDLIVGNIATSEAVKDYLSINPDAFRVGLGAGSICITRIVTGVGVPQASAIHLVYLEAKKYGIPIIADGGIRYGGDIVKALALGADTVMCGNLFAGCDESPTEIINGSKYGLEGKYKLYRGMGSESVIKSVDRYMVSKKYAPEGIEGIVPYKGSVENVINEFSAALKQAMGYIGARNIKELREKAIFINITNQAFKEGFPHNIFQLKNF